MNVLVIGASGFIGSAITKRLDRINVEWSGIDAVTHDSKVKQLIVSEEKIELLVQEFNKYQYIINASGSLKPNDFINGFESAMEASWSYLSSLSKALRASNVKKYLHISSAGTVYGEAHNEAFDETSETSPTNWYGRTKLLEELLLKKTAEESHFDFCCARLSNPYGNQRSASHGLVDVLIHSVLEQKKFVAKFNSSTSRDFIYIDDAAKKIVNILLSKEIGVFNIGSGKAEKLLDIVQFVHSLKPDSSIVFEYDEKFMGVCHSRISIEKYRKAFGEDEDQSLYDYIESKVK